MQDLRDGQTRRSNQITKEFAVRFQQALQPQQQEGNYASSYRQTAFLIGGASGIGLALGRALAAAGMNVMLEDIETEVLNAAVNSLLAVTANAHGTSCDVADAASVQRAAQATYDAFG